MVKFTNTVDMGFGLTGTLLLSLTLKPVNGKESPVDSVTLTTSLFTMGMRSSPMTRTWNTTSDHRGTKRHGSSRWFPEETPAGVRVMANGLTAFPMLSPPLRNQICHLPPVSNQDCKALFRGAGVTPSTSPTGLMVASLPSSPRGHAASILRVA